jgi:hypothetical protein
MDGHGDQAGETDLGFEGEGDARHHGFQLDNMRLCVLVVLHRLHLQVID